MAKDAENQQVTKETQAKSVPLSISIDNTPVKRANGETISFYGRLLRYAKKKGISEQDVMRYATSMLLDKVGE